RQPAMLIQQRVGTGAVNILQQQVMLLGCRVLSNIDGPNNVWVMEQLAALCFTIETINQNLIAGQALRQNFDGDLLTKLFLIAQVHGPHTALTQTAQYAKFAEAARILQRVGRRARRRLGGIEVCGVHGVRYRYEALASPGQREARLSEV